MSVFLVRNLEYLKKKSGFDSFYIWLRIMRLIKWWSNIGWTCAETRLGPVYHIATSSNLLILLSGTLFIIKLHNDRPCLLDHSNSVITVPARLEYTVLEDRLWATSPGERPVQRCYNRQAVPNAFFQLRNKSLLCLSDTISWAPSNTDVWAVPVQ